MGGIAEASREALWVSLQIGGPLLVLLLLTPFFTGVLRGYAQGLFEMVIQVGSRP